MKAEVKNSKLKMINQDKQNHITETETHSTYYIYTAIQYNRYCLLQHFQGLSIQKSRTKPQQRAFVCLIEYESPNVKAMSEFRPVYSEYHPQPGANLQVIRAIDSHGGMFPAGLSNC